MNETLEFLVRHGSTVLLVAVFVEQIGVPLPATPWLLVAGALAASAKINWIMAVCAAALGSVLADAIWFYLGRYRGQSILRLLCRLSLEPSSCVRGTQDLFSKYGMRGVIVAKFIPGLSVLAPPLAGSSGVKASRFFFFDGLGSMLYGGCFILLGVLFSQQLEQILAALATFGDGALVVAIALPALYIGYKVFQRRRVINELRVARITVDELLRMLNADEKPIILDLRSGAELEQDASLIRGALHMTVDEVEIRHQEIPRDRDIILYCSCPNEVSSARVALLLRQRGIVRVRPLLGGFDAWREQKYPTEFRAASSTSPALREAVNLI